MTPLDVVGATIPVLRAALEDGVVTSVELVARYLERIAFYDRHGITLNSVPVLNEHAFAEARASDERRSAGASLGPLDGIPYTAKDSYAVRGMTLAAGSPAFADLRASADAFTIERLRAAGAVLIGRTNMPPMANGGMQRGLYGRAESPYSADFLTAAFASGSSNGSGTATAASFAAFGLGEETWSSGRAPAANNALVAYTPSRGVISARGNWPLVPTMDVVVPHTRTVGDLLEVLDVIVADDPVARGDFWRVQPWVSVPAASAVRPPSYVGLRTQGALRGRRLGVPRMYINRDAEVTHPIETRASVIELWERARADLLGLGAEVVEVDFPVVSNYERDRPGARSMVDRGLVPEEFERYELWELSMLAWHDFLDANAHPGLSALADVAAARVFPHPTGALPDRYDGDVDLGDYVARARAGAILPLEDIPCIEEGLRGLERARQHDLEDWMTEHGLDAVVFPAVADVGPADADTDPASADIAWRNGTWVANGNQAIRHLGVPTVTVPMGLMSDIGMPAGLTFAGRAYSDTALLSYAAELESVAPRRVEPERVPALEQASSEVRHPRGHLHPPGTAPVLTLTAEVASAEQTGLVTVAAALTVDSPTDVVDVEISVNGVRVAVAVVDGVYRAVSLVPAEEHSRRHSEWREPYGSLVVAVVRGDSGACAGAVTVAGGII